MTSPLASRTTVDFPPPPELIPLARVECEVTAIVSLGNVAGSERRYVPLVGGRVSGPELNGWIAEGGIDWQWVRPDGLIDIAAHYTIRTDDGALIEVRSEGLRYGAPDVLARLARGEPVPREAMYFRTAVRFTTGAPAWVHLNRTLAIACGARDARMVRLDFYRVA